LLLYSMETLISPNNLRFRLYLFIVEETQQ
jgi:hypothetical protein